LASLEVKVLTPLEPKKKVTTIANAADRRTSRNGRSEKNKPQTPGGVPLEESIGSNLKLPSGL